MNPKTEALAFRIWAYSDPRDWNVTTIDVAEALEVDRNRVSRVVALKRWAGRFRSTSSDAAVDCMMNNSHNGLAIEAANNKRDTFKMMGLW